MWCDQTAVSMFSLLKKLLHLPSCSHCQCDILSVTLSKLADSSLNFRMGDSQLEEAEAAPPKFTGGDGLAEMEECPFEPVASEDEGSSPEGSGDSDSDSESSSDSDKDDLEVIIPDKQFYEISYSNSVL